MLAIRGLHSHYGLSHIIQGIDLDARPGEVIGIFGRNGVGKTTLLKTIAGWVTASDGISSARHSLAANNRCWQWRASWSVSRVSC